MKICKGCGDNIPNKILINNKKIRLEQRKFCLKCRPYKNNLTEDCHIFYCKYSKEQLIDIIKNSYSITQVLTKLNMKTAGGNYSTIKKYIKLFNIKTSHFTGQGHLKGKTHNFRPAKPLKDLLKENISYSSDKLRKRLISANHFQHKCYKCQNTEWQGQPIPIELEHINGDHTDNRLENLTILCPNCHAQTKTYRGKNKKAS